MVVEAEDIKIAEMLVREKEERKIRDECPGITQEELEARIKGK